ncbi:MAG: RT0821/Lpp0805 family surface protein [Alphaproteobacteria bacterium]
MTMRQNRHLRKSGFAVSAMCAASIALSACGNVPKFDRDETIATGVVAGALIGGLIGYSALSGSASGELIGMALGAGAGAVGGYYAADYLTRLDRRAMEETTYATLTDSPIGETRSWNNEGSGNSGEVHAIRTFMSGEGQLCRDYANVAKVQGERIETYHTACRNAAGAWVVSQTSKPLL